MQQTHEVQAPTKDTNTDQNGLGDHGLIPDTVKSREERQRDEMIF